MFDSDRDAYDSADDVVRDWQDEVMNDDTQLGFAEWCLHQAEAAASRRHQNAANALLADMAAADMATKDEDYHAPHARNVLALTNSIRGMFLAQGEQYQPVWKIEEEEMLAPGGTDEFDGRVQTFIFHENGREYRVLVEDITVEDEYIEARSREAQAEA